MKNNTFSDKQQSIIMGSLLGDGHITKTPYGNSAFTKCQCGAHRDYLEWHYQQFGPTLSSPIKPCWNSANGKKYIRYNFRIMSNSFFTELRNTWYPQGKKIVPSNITLTPLSLAIWYFDDGSNILSARKASFATYCFSPSDTQILANLIKKQFNISCFVNSSGVLVIRAESYKSFIDIIRPYMLWPCFEHKIAYRDSKASPSPQKADIDKIMSWYQSKKSVKWITANTNFSPSCIYHYLHKNKEKITTNPDKKLALNNTSGIKGVSYDKSRHKWIASFRVNGKRTRLGRYNSKEEAFASLQKFINPSVQHSNIYHS